MMPAPYGDVTRAPSTHSLADNRGDVTTVAAPVSRGINLRNYPPSPTCYCYTATVPVRTRDRAGEPEERDDGTG